MATKTKTSDTELNEAISQANERAAKVAPAGGSRCLAVRSARILSPPANATGWNRDRARLGSGG